MEHWYRRWHSWDCRRYSWDRRRWPRLHHCGTDFGADISVVVQLLTSGLGTNDDPQPPATTLTIPPTTRLADGLNFDLLNRSRHSICVGQIDGGHIGSGRSGSESAHVASHSNTSHRLAEGTTTVLAWRPRHKSAGGHQQSFRWIKANWARSHCDTPAIDGLGRCAAHTHCLNCILTTVTRENGKPSSGQLMLRPANGG